MRRLRVQHLGASEVLALRRDRGYPQSIDSAATGCCVGRVDHGGDCLSRNRHAAVVGDVMTRAEIWVQFAAAGLYRSVPIVAAAEHADAMLTEFNKRFYFGDDGIPRAQPYYDAASTTGAKLK